MENLKINYLQDCINIAGNTTGRFESIRANEELANIQQKNRKKYEALKKVKSSSHFDEMSSILQTIINEALI